MFVGYFSFIFSYLILFTYVLYINCSFNLSLLRSLVKIILGTSNIYNFWVIHLVFVFVISALIINAAYKYL